MIDSVFSWIKGIPKDLPITAAPELLVVESMQSYGMIIAFSTRIGGVSTGPYTALNIDDRSGDDLDNVQTNRGLIRDTLNLPAKLCMYTLDQIHSDVILDMKSLHEGYCRGDGVEISRSAAAMLMFADCVPLILADSRNQRLLTIHAGWRGIVSGIVNRAIEKIVVGKVFDSIQAFFGPAIRGCCYELGYEASQAFGLPVETGNFDLVGYMTDQLIDLGMTAENIHDCGLCTYCDQERFFSFRRDGEKTGRQASVAALL